MPQTKTPGLEVSIGSKVRVWQNPCLFNFTPTLLASFLTVSDGVKPTERTTKSKSSSWGVPLSPSNRILRFLVLGISSTSDTLHLINLTPYLFFALSIYLSKSFP